MWGEEFHIDEGSSKILISVITSETFPIESKTYQGYNTLWYELKETNQGFNMELIDKWNKSDIKAIRSKVHNGERIWVALRELNYISSSGNKGRSSFIGVAKNNQLEIPQFEFSNSNQHSHLSQNFDIELTDKEIFISGIGSVVNDTPTILRIAKDRKSMEFIELDIPLMKLHNFHDTVIKKIDNQFFAYFWTTSSEYCKKYTFEIFAVRLKQSLANSTYEKAFESDYIHSFTWSNNAVAFKTNTGKTPCRLGKIDIHGRIVQTEELEISDPKLLTNEGEVIVLSDDRKQLLKIK
ncbi:MAG: hypothetical protein KDC80_25115 [Saprospiraceae bacterium]|nr:hypothetical protein [Saprospiraceae bacterium]